MRYTLRRWGMQAIVALSVGLGAWTSAEAQSLTWLGILAGDHYSYATSVSSDAVVVGVSTYDRYDPCCYYNPYEGCLPCTFMYMHAFRWTAQGGMQRLDTLPGGEESAAYGVSADGRVVVGWVDGGDRLLASRWTAQGLDTLSSNWSAAYGVSADGRVVVGSVRDASREFRAFRWTVQGGMQNLGTLPGGRESRANGVSADGSVVVGMATNASGQWRAFRWTVASGTMQDLGTLPGRDESQAYGVSADGSVVVGVATYAGGQARAFRWVQGRGMHDLGVLPGRDRSVARSVSADGSVVVGGAADSTIWRAFRWKEGRGMEDLNQTYASLLTGGSYLEYALAISPDGRYIVGWGYNAATGRREAYLLDTWRTGDTNGDECINEADLLNVLFAFGTPGTGYTRHEDINKDGIVDDADLLMVLFNFGQGC